MGANLSKKAKDRLEACKKDGGRDLNLSDCDLNDPKAFKALLSLKNLTKLNLARNSLCAIPDNVDKLAQLEFLNVDQNGIERVPPAINNLANLKHLALSGNALTELPPMGSLRALTHLDVSYNNLTALPSDLNQCPLAELVLRGNRMGATPTTVFTLGNKLKLLDVSDCKLRGTVDDKYLQLSVLEHLNLGRNEMSEFPAVVCKMRTIKHIDMSGNSITAVPDAFMAMNHLSHILLEENRITSLDNINFQPWAELVELNLMRNQLTRLPHGLGHCQKLKNVFLSENPLVSLPREIGWCDKTMRKLWLENTKLETLPGELCFLTTSLELRLDKAPLKYPFREWYAQSVPYLLSQLKPYCAAYPGLTYAEGPALTSGQAGVPSEFRIVSFDKAGDKRSTGGDNVVIEIRDLSGKVVCQGFCNDQKDGTFKGFYNSRWAGQGKLHVLAESQDCKGSPYDIKIEPGALEIGCCTLSGDGLSRGTVGTPVSFLIEARDRFDNLLGRPGEQWQVAIRGSQQVPQVMIDDRHDGTYVVTFHPAFPGEYDIRVAHKSAPAQIIGGKPHFCMVN